MLRKILGWSGFWRVAMEFSDTMVFVTGHARPVKDDAITAVYQVFSLSLIIETLDDSIADVSCTMVMQESADFIRHLLRGKNILTDMGVIADQIKGRFFTLAQKPMMVALRDAQNRYLMAFPEKRAGECQSKT
ncbi:MAG: DUF3870 domain-containing protein [Oscillospiraceae bacterium]|nr:DUF3870 domain-containing protein [Oscillospiraceae bacterium]